MKFLKSFLFFSFIFTTFFFSIPQAVVAVKPDTHDFKVKFESIASDVPCGENGQFKCLVVPWLSDYIEALFRYGVQIAVVLAVIMIMVGGIVWLTSAGSSQRVGTAKEIILSALLGLFLALLSYVILNTINPRITELSPLSVPTGFSPVSDDGFKVDAPVSEIKEIINMPPEGQL